MTDPTPSRPVSCVIYRCSSQDQMYLFTLAGFDLAELPPALRKRMGQLTAVMDLQLTPERRLARARVETVMEQLSGQGWYLQMPPNGDISAHLYFGD